MTFSVGAYSVDADISVQWYRGDKKIAGETASDHTITSADLGKKLSVKVTASDYGWLPYRGSSAKTQTIRASYIAGTPSDYVGVTEPGAFPELYAGLTGITESDVVVKVRWFRNGKARTKFTTNRVYQTTQKDAGKYLQPIYVVTKPGYTRLVIAGTKDFYSLRVDGQPTLDITAPRVDDTVTVTPPEYWPSDSVSFDYQWYRDGKKISGAEAATYTVVAADRGKRLSVKVTADRPQYIPVIRTAKATADTRKALVGG